MPERQEQCPECGGELWRPTPDTRWGRCNKCARTVPERQELPDGPEEMPDSHYIGPPEPERQERPLAMTKEAREQGCTCAPAASTWLERENARKCPLHGEPERQERRKDLRASEASGMASRSARVAPAPLERQERIFACDCGRVVVRVGPAPLCPDCDTYANRPFVPEGSGYAFAQWLIAEARHERDQVVEALATTQRLLREAVERAKKEEAWRHEMTRKGEAGELSGWKQRAEAAEERADRLDAEMESYRQVAEGRKIERDQAEAEALAQETGRKRAWERVQAAEDERDQAEERMKAGLEGARLAVVEYFDEQRVKAEAERDQALEQAEEAMGWAYLQGLEYGEARHREALERIMGASRGHRDIARAALDAERGAEPQPGKPPARAGESAPSLAERRPDPTQPSP